MERSWPKPEIVGHATGAAVAAAAAETAAIHATAPKIASALQLASTLLGLLIIGVVFFVLGLKATLAAEAPKALPPAMQRDSKVVYPGRTKLDFEGAQIEGELRNPSEFYFLSRESEKFDSLVKRRKNFHREMLRDVVLTK